MTLSKPTHLVPRIQRFNKHYKYIRMFIKFESMRIRWLFLLNSTFVHSPSWWILRQFSKLLLWPVLSDIFFTSTFKTIVLFHLTLITLHSWYSKNNFIRISLFSLRSARFIIFPTRHNTCSPLGHRPSGPQRTHCNLLRNWQTVRQIALIFGQQKFERHQFVPDSLGIKPTQFS